MRTSCLGGSSVMLVPKLLLNPIKIRIFGPKLVQNMHFWSFWAKYCHFLHILSNARPKTNVNKVPGWVFRYVGYKTFDFSSKKRFFCPKTTKFGPKLAFLVIMGQILPFFAHFVQCPTKKQCEQGA